MLGPVGPMATEILSATGTVHLLWFAVRVRVLPFCWALGAFGGDGKNLGISVGPLSVAFRFCNAPEKDQAIGAAETKEMAKAVIEMMRGRRAGAIPFCPNPSCNAPLGGLDEAGSQQCKKCGYTITFATHPLKERADGDDQG